MRIMPRFMGATARLMAGAMVLSLVACGGQKVTPPPPPPPQVKQAQLTATFANATWELSPRTNFNYRLSFDLTVRETAGTGAKLNFLRADFRDSNGSFVERQEAGSNALNRINGNSTLSDRITIDFNDGRTSSAFITLNAIDDTGRIVEMTMTILCC